MFFWIPHLWVLTVALIACGGRKSEISGTTMDEAELEQESIVIADGPDEDTLCVYDGNTVIYSYAEVVDGLESLASEEIKVYSDGKPVKISKVKGYGYPVSGEGTTLKIAVGVDTEIYDISSLPKTLNPVMDLAGKGTQKYRMRHTFKADGDQRNCTFLVLPSPGARRARRSLTTLMYSGGNIKKCTHT